jgi:hypothetical protein
MYCYTECIVKETKELGGITNMTDHYAKYRETLEDGWAVAAAGHLDPTDTSGEAQETRERAERVTQREKANRRGK